jgi:hypothetical protein
MQVCDQLVGEHEGHDGVMWNQVHAWVKML